MNQKQHNFLSSFSFSSKIKGWRPRKPLPCSSSPCWLWWWHAPTRVQQCDAANGANLSAWKSKVHLKTHVKKLAMVFAYNLVEKEVGILFYPLIKMRPREALLFSKIGFRLFFSFSLRTKTLICDCRTNFFSSADVGVF